jgi:hypothetical protein
VFVKTIESTEKCISFLRIQKPELSKTKISSTIHKNTCTKLSQIKNVNTCSNESQSTSKCFFSFKCHTCETLFSTRTSLNYHLSTHKGRDSFQCRFCNKEFINRWKLNSHLARHNKNISTVNKSQLEIND